MIVCCEVVTEQYSYQLLNIVALTVRGCPKLEGRSSANQSTFQSLDSGRLIRYQGCALNLNHMAPFSADCK